MIPELRDVWCSFGASNEQVEVSGLASHVDSHSKSDGDDCGKGTIEMESAKVLKSRFSSHSFSLPMGFPVFITALSLRTIC